MLTHIKINNFAIIHELELDFTSGFSVLTGETGAGKSIIVDALSLALGARADSQVVRADQEKAEIALTFDITKLPLAQEWLKSQDLNLETDECVIRRIITQEGRSKAYINGSTTPVQQLRQLGGLLVEIHGQHEHQSLLIRETQQLLLDDFEELTPLTKQLGKLALQWQQCYQDLQRIKASLHEKQARAEYLQFQLNELTSLDLQPGEYARLETEHQRLAHAEEILTTAHQCIQALDDDEHAVSSLLHQQLNELHRLCHLDSALKEAYELFENASLQINEGIKTLRHYSNRLELEPDKLQWLEQRISTIHDLSRKHHLQAEQLIEFQKTLQHELDALAFSDKHIAHHEQQIDELHQQYHTLADKLTKGRQHGAQKLASAIEDIIRQLGLPNGKFHIQLTAITDKQLPSKGLERIDFLVSTNPGQPAAPLNKVASGGELSRISLAIQVIAAHNSANMTFVFDEVDTGIGGGTAETVGLQLAKLGKNHQVFCVTHLAQVAAQGHHHFSVTKHTDGKSTTTTIEKLGDQERIAEIARMLGGIEITDHTRTHASEMLKRFAPTSVKSKRPRKSA